MPVSRKKKRITAASDAASLEPSSPLLPSQQEFHAYLRSLAQSAVRTVIEAVMREELDPTPHFFSSRSNMAFTYKSGWINSP